MADLIIDNLSRDYGAVRVLDRVSLTVRDGEFLTLLGPSGCGKTTTLFSIAGLDRPSEGRIALGNQIFFDRSQGRYLPPEKRNCGLVFQSYALWPHMTVLGNVEFPLRLRKISGAALREKAGWALSLVEMQDYAKRFPHELSGGQQQRVALARTLVYEPQLLLLDEPLSNLDAKLRLRARGWLRELQARLKITTIYVTHDQDEALALSDRIAVMNGGKIVQLGTPQEIFRNPVSAFIADFVGNSNILSGRVQSQSDGRIQVVLEDQQCLQVEAPTGGDASEFAQIAVRPEHVILRSPRIANGLENSLSGRIVQRDFLGTEYEYLVEAGGTIIRVVTRDEFEHGAVNVELPLPSCIGFWGASKNPKGRAVPDSAADETTKKAGSIL